MKSLKSSYIKRFLEPNRFYKDPKTDTVYRVSFVRGKGNYAEEIEYVPATETVIDLGKEAIDPRYFKREKDRNRLHLRWKAQKECLQTYVEKYGPEILNKVEESYAQKIV